MYAPRHRATNRLERANRIIIDQADRPLLRLLRKIVSAAVYMNGLWGLVNEIISWVR